jgi:hypothetical protein
MKLEELFRVVYVLIFKRGLSTHRSAHVKAIIINYIFCCSIKGISQQFFFKVFQEVLLNTFEIGGIKFFVSKQTIALNNRTR